MEYLLKHLEVRSIHVIPAYAAAACSGSVMGAVLVFVFTVMQGSPVENALSVFTVVTAFALLFGFTAGLLFIPAMLLLKSAHLLSAVALTLVGAVIAGSIVAFSSDLFWIPATISGGFAGFCSFCLLARLSASDRNGR